MLVVQCEKIALQIVLWWIKKLLVRKKEDGTSRGLKRTIKCPLSGGTIINQAVTLGSNFLAVDPVGRVSRFSRKEKRKIQVSQLHMISQYNKFMGGVDLADNMLANYRIRIRGKKVVVANFFQLH